jgi:hypothetical protein
VEFLSATAMRPFRARALRPPELCVPAGYADAHPPTRCFRQCGGSVGGIPVGQQERRPLQTFEELLRGVGADGSRAHSLADACTVP